MVHNLKTVVVAVLLASISTLLGTPFGIYVMKTGTPGTLGVDYHGWVTFFQQKIVDVGHSAAPGMELRMGLYAFVLNFIFFDVITYFIIKYWGERG